MQKTLVAFILGLLVWSNANAHTSISFSIQPSMGYSDYEDLLLLEQIRARRIQNRLMQMRYARMYGLPMYPQYYIEERPYLMRTHRVYIQNTRHAQKHCHRHHCHQ